MQEIYIARTVGYASNCYMLVSDGQGAVIDPSVPISAFRLPDNVRVTKVLLTHGHFDHILAIDSYVKDGAEVFVSEYDAYMLKDAMANASAVFGLDPIVSVATPNVLKDGDIIEHGSAHIKVMATPGHTEGSVCYISDNVMFSGDTLFAEGIGRCDLIGGDYYTMQVTLSKIAKLDVDYKVYPGHGELTTLNKEIKYNYELSRFNAQNI